jgi:hypothetical protein
MAFCGSGIKTKDNRELSVKQVRVLNWDNYGEKWISNHTYKECSEMIGFIIHEDDEMYLEEYGYDIFE